MSVQKPSRVTECTRSKSSSLTRIPWPLLPALVEKDYEGFPSLVSPQSDTPDDDGWGDCYWINKGWRIAAKWILPAQLKYLREELQYSAHLASQSVEPSFILADVMAIDPSFDRTIRYGIDLEEMHNICTGSRSNVVDYLKAEGLVMRCMLGSVEHEKRLVFLRMWMCMFMFRFDDDDGKLKSIFSSLDALEEIAVCSSLCSCSLTMEDAFMRYSTLTVRLCGIWNVVVKNLFHLRQYWMEIGLPFNERGKCVVPHSENWDSEYSNYLRGDGRTAAEIEKDMVDDIQGIQ